MSAHDDSAVGAGRRGPMLAHVGLFWVVYIVVLVSTSEVKHRVPEGGGPLAWGLASCVLLFPLSWLMLRWENRRLPDAGLNIEARSILRLVGGLMIAWATFAVILGVVALIAGGLRFERGVAVNAGLVLQTLATVFALACMEELGFRGYALRTLPRGLGVWPAQLVVAAAFGLCHIAFGWTWAAVLLGVVPSALLFGVTALRSGGLAMPLGVHAGLNLAQWYFSQNATGVWKVVLSDEQAKARVALLAPGIGAAITLATAWAVWRWYPKTGSELMDTR